MINNNQKNIPCRLCGGESNYLQEGELIGIVVSYFECPSCGYVQTESPHWLDQAYAQAINGSDTGIMLRNQANARIVMATLFMLGKLDGIVVDCAGGYGILVRLLRDFGVNALWSDRYCQNLVARGFEHDGEQAELVSAFEAFEHFINPGEELDRLLTIAPNVLISTAIISDPPPHHDDWWYYGKEHGQHIGFFRVSTLEKLAKERGKFLVSNGDSYHLISDKPINHVAWNLMIRLSKFAPFLLKRKLVSKVWTDHYKIAGLTK